MSLDLDALDPAQARSLRRLAFDAASFSWIVFSRGGPDADWWFGAGIGFLKLEIHARRAMPCVANAVTAERPVAAGRG